MTSGIFRKGNCSEAFKLLLFLSSFFSSTKFAEKNYRYASAGLELRLSKLKASTLTAWSPPRPNYFYSWSTVSSPCRVLNVFVKLYILRAEQDRLWSWPVYFYFFSQTTFVSKIRPATTTAAKYIIFLTEWGVTTFVCSSYAVNNEKTTVDCTFESELLDDNNNNQHLNNNYNIKKNIVI